MKVEVYKIGQSSPNDISGLRTLVENGTIDPTTIVAIMGKTEGNGCVNDFTRGYAVSTISSYLSSLQQSSSSNSNDVDPNANANNNNKVVYIMSGGTEGILSPHMTVFTRIDDDSNEDDDEDDDGTTAGNNNNNSNKKKEKRLAIGTYHTRDFTPQEIGTMTMVDVVADGVKHAIQSAQITCNDDVHFVQIKCPLLVTSASSSSSSSSTSFTSNSNSAVATGNNKKRKTTASTTTTTASTTTITQDSYKSMAYSRGASALGVAIALNELQRDQLLVSSTTPPQTEEGIQDEDNNSSRSASATTSTTTTTKTIICNDYNYYSCVASTSAGVELQNCEILVMGNSTYSSKSNYCIGHDVMEHALDVNAVTRAITNAKSHVVVLQHHAENTTTTNNDIVNVFAKAEASPSGLILGCRHTMLDDSDINHTRMARAVVGAVIASVLQDPMIYVSGGSEHQGPPGGGPIAVILKV